VRGNTRFISRVEHDISLVRAAPMYYVLFNTDHKKYGHNFYLQYLYQNIPGVYFEIYRVYILISCNVKAIKAIANEIKIIAFRKD
jgi:hypothetical protein